MLVEGLWDLPYTGWHIEGDLSNQVAVSKVETTPIPHKSSQTRAHFRYYGE